MPVTDRIVQLVVSVFLIVGVYQFYFWCQRHPFFPPREFRSRFDALIPYRPRWVWIYSFLYYPVIVAVNWCVTCSRQFLYVLLSFILLLLFQMVFFLLFPVATPAEWRARNQRRGPSERLLALVQSFDGRSNSFPSMHASVAMLTALHLFPMFGAWAFAFPALICLSCLFTKQHYFVDLPAGLLLGWFVFTLYQRLYPAF
jgi:membrane-associated phospholipid phosphatase